MSLLTSKFSCGVFKTLDSGPCITVTASNTFRTLWFVNIDCFDLSSECVTICSVACQNYYHVRITTCITGTMDIHNPCQNYYRVITEAICVKKVRVRVCIKSTTGS